MPPQLKQVLVIDTETGAYLPPVFINEFWRPKSALAAINETVTELSLRLDFSCTTLMRWQLTALPLTLTPTSTLAVTPTVTPTPTLTPTPNPNPNPSPNPNHNPSQAAHRADAAESRDAEPDARRGLDGGDQAEP